MTYTLSETLERLVLGFQEASVVISTRGDGTFQLGFWACHSPWTLVGSAAIGCDCVFSRAVIIASELILSAEL